MNPINPSPNTARGYARDLPQPQAWTNATAKRVFDALSQSPCLVDLYLIEASARAVRADELAAYGGRPHVIAYRMWDVPGPQENAQDYLVRHIAAARQFLGGVPYVNGAAC